MTDVFRGEGVVLLDKTTGLPYNANALDQSLPVRDSTNGLAYPDSYAHTLTYNADGTLNTDAFTDGTNTWTQTFGYTTGKVTSISRWVKT